jgi:DNA ligase-1
MGVKKPSKKLLEEFPVSFIAYDMLAQNRELFLEFSFEQRRKKLESFASDVQLPISLVYPLESENDIKTRFSIAKAHGNEGLMLKKKSSLYEFGQRGNAWIKVKEPGGSLDTVILYAHAGSGKRGGLYSDFTLAVRSGVKNDGTPFFVPIGKAYGGFTDAELKRLNSEIRGLITDRFGPTAGLQPKIVVELEFEEIQENKRTKAGFTLRLPRFKAIRWDLSIHDTDSLDDVKAQFEAQLNRQRIPNSENPFLQIPT